MFTLMVRSASLRLEPRGQACGHPSRRIAEPVIGRAFARPVDDALQGDAGSLGGTGNPLLPAVAPPSIGSVMPVIQRDSSLARNSAP
jgi:hypothetical protein